MGLLKKWSRSVGSLRLTTKNRIGGNRNEGDPCYNPKKGSTRIRVERESCDYFPCGPLGVGALHSCFLVR